MFPFPLKKQMILKIKEAKLRKILMFAAIVVLAACTAPQKKSEDLNLLAREAVETYLTGAKGIELKNVTVEIANLKKEGETVLCEVNVALKENPQQKFTYKYTLKQEAGKWKVASSEPVGGSHAGKPMGQGMPEGHPPVGDGEQAAPGQMPLGHPPMSANPHDPAQPQMQDGHEKPAEEK